MNYSFDNRISILLLEDFFVSIRALVEEFTKSLKFQSSYLRISLFLEVRLAITPRGPPLISILLLEDFFVSRSYVLTTMLLHL